MPSPALSVQLYSLRREFSEDAEAALRSVPSLGFDGVELAGDYGWSADKWVDLLGETGLLAASAHVALEKLEQAFEETLAFYKVLGCQRLIVPHLSEEIRTVSGYADVAKRLDLVAEKFKAADVLLGYHNHDFEFAPLEGGSTGMDILLAGTDPSLVFFEFDTYWLERGGQIADAYLAEHVARVGMVHAKELRKADNADVPAGEGDIDFAKIVTLAKTNHWPLVVEFEGENAPDAVRKSAAYLKTLL